MTIPHVPRRPQLPFSINTQYGPLAAQAKDGMFPHSEISVFLVHLLTDEGFRPPKAKRGTLVPKSVQQTSSPSASKHTASTLNSPDSTYLPLSPERPEVRHLT